MIDNLRTLVISHLYSKDEINPTELQFTKFCQRIVGPHTKVLFLVTYRGRYVCIIKTVRYPEFNVNLQREKRAQGTARAVGLVRAPRIYFEGTVGERYVYAEEVIDGPPISKKKLMKRMPEIQAFASAFPKQGSISAKELHAKLAPYIPDIEMMKDTYELQLTHGDLGRPNILDTGQELVVIDWERAGDIPVNDPSIEKQYQILYKKYPQKYRALVSKFHFPI